jgi:hypothetical protein
MARRKTPEAVSGPVFGVRGLFLRTEEAWRALGAPASLYDRDAACAAVRRCAKPAYSRAFILDSPNLPAGGLEFVAREWWQTARPRFLIRRDALTGEERRQIDKYPAMYGPSSGYHDAAVELELFGADLLAQETRNR